MNMLCRITGVLAVLLALPGALLPPRVNAAISWRVSVKVLLDTSNNWPTSTATFNLCSRERIAELVAEYNRLLDAQGWGYRLQLTEILEVRDSAFYDADPKPDWANFEKEVNLHRSQYAYQGNALNVYVSHSDGVGVTTAFPPLPLLGNVILLGKAPNRDTMLHEIGHTLNLCHTHGCGINECNGDCPGDDTIADTLPDISSWGARDDVAFWNFSNRPYSALSPGEQKQVDDIWWNLMSYHNGGVRNRLSRGQWEKLVGISNDPLGRRMVCTGSTAFVDKTASGHSPCELASQLAGLVDSLSGPTSWYEDALQAHPPGPEYLTLKTCRNFDIDPPVIDRPSAWPSGWIWPPLPGAPRPSNLLYPSDWPWPPDPAPFTICLGGAYKTIQDAIDCAASATQPGDRLQIMAGNYNETISQATPMRITKPLTLATDGGPVFIGRP